LFLTNPIWRCFYSDNDFHTDAFQANYSNEEAGNLFEAQHTFGLSADVDDGFASNGPVAAASVPLAQQNYPSLPREEPEKIRKWREEQKLRLQKKDAEEEKKKTEMKEAARKELEDWYKHHKEAIEKTRLANRNAEKELISQPSELEPGQEWERIAKLCDFNPKASRNSKDVSRMRSIILQLKQTPPTKA